MNHSFNIHIAKEYGIEEAILIENIAFWIKRNLANKKNIHDGQCWVFNSVSAFSEIFPYIKTSKINRVLRGLVKKGVLISGNYNKVKYDRTKWYSISDKKIKKIYEIDFSKCNKNKEKKKLKISKCKIATNIRIRHFSKCKMDLYKSKNGFVHFAKSIWQYAKPIPDIKKVINKVIKKDRLIKKNHQSKNNNNSYEIKNQESNQEIKNNNLDENRKNEIISKFNKFAKKKIIDLSGRIEKVQNLIKQYSYRDLLIAIKRINKSKYLIDNLDFDSLIKPNFFKKVFEGNYDDRVVVTKQTTPKSNKFNNFKQRTDSYSSEQLKDIVLRKTRASLNINKELAI
ncbi:MAG: hypothetical protein N4A54_14215 [Peptostreptococcaceae bacterium]|jgi:hypothetical protein|nr:hypothetical protein [Peptostreptococcaceae bacterium]